MEAKISERHTKETSLHRRSDQRITNQASPLLNLIEKSQEKEKQNGDAKNILAHRRLARWTKPFATKISKSQPLKHDTLINQ